MDADMRKWGRGSGFDMAHLPGERHDMADPSVEQKCIDNGFIDRFVSEMSRLA